MTAGANPIVDMNGSESNTNGASASNNDGRSALPEKFAVVTGFKRDVVISFDWTPDEQSLLEELLVKYASDNNKAMSYAKIAQELHDKTARDVAIRVSLMEEKEKGKKKRDDNGPSRKQKDRREKIAKQPATNRASMMASLTKVLVVCPRIFLSRMPRLWIKFLPKRYRRTSIFFAKREKTLLQS